MIQLCGVNLEQLPDRSALSRCIDPVHYEAWCLRHRGMRDERAARASLGGLWLLEHCGVRGALAYDADGRPYLAHTALDFNITHTDRQIFCAVETPDGAFDTAWRVGLDAEHCRRIRNDRIEPLARRWFTEAELAVFQKDPTNLAFLRLWTRKEALVKWTGEGIRAMRGMDTTRAESELEVRFCEYRLGDTLVTLCCRASATPPREIEMLTDPCLFERDFCNT